MGISTHVLDTALGRPAAGVAVSLSIEENGCWMELFVSRTDREGRCARMLPELCELQVATYRLRFGTADYYASQKADGLYPFVDVTFMVTNSTEHYHVPLLLTGHGYMTYRGS